MSLDLQQGSIFLDGVVRKCLKSDNSPFPFLDFRFLGLFLLLNVKEFLVMLLTFAFAHAGF
jgi:hypothetical protein